MTDTTGSEQTPTVEIIVRREGEIIERQLCDTMEEAADLADAWEETAGTEVTVVPITPGEVEEEPAIHERSDDTVTQTSNQME